MPNKTYRIKDAEDNDLGIVNVEVPDEAVFDFALTPIVTVAPDKEPRVDGFLASPRTELDTRPRETRPPYLHIGPCNRKNDSKNV